LSGLAGFLLFDWMFGHLFIYGIFKFNGVYTVIPLSDTAIRIHQDDLLADWQLAVTGKKPFPMRGLDQ
jgi:hypothetical protein